MLMVSYLCTPLTWRDSAQPSDPAYKYLSRSNYEIKYARNFPR